MKGLCYVTKEQAEMMAMWEVKRGHREKITCLDTGIIDFASDWIYAVSDGKVEEDYNSTSG